MPLNYAECKQKPYKITTINMLVTMERAKSNTGKKETLLAVVKFRRCVKLSLSGTVWK